MQRAPAFSAFSRARLAVVTMVAVFGLLVACDRSPPSPALTAQSAGSLDSARVSPSAAPSASTPAPAPAAFVPVKVEVKDAAMGTALHFIAYTSPRADEAAARAAIARAIAEMRRLEGLMSEWRDDSEIGQVNLKHGEWVSVSPETFDVLERSIEAGKLSKGTFDITFQSMSGVWKFGSAQEEKPRVPSKPEIEKLRRLVDYRKVELDEARRAVRIGAQQKIGLGGIAKGYIVDRAAQVLKDAGLESFLVQAGGDLYGSGKKADGSPWVSGIQDPRGPHGKFFAVLELTDRAFSTAGDYARSYVVDGKRYHHIIDPRTGYPASASRSVTIWAPDATTADVIDDLVFILGPQEGLPIVESIDGVGAVIVDRDNKVWISKRLAGRVKVLAEPTGGL